MASADLQGGRFDMRASPPNGVKIDCQYTTDGTTALSLANASIVGYLMDDNGSLVASYNMAITNAANGEFDLIFPATAFTDLWGEQIAYVVHAQYTSETAPTPLMYGVITLQEAR